MTDWNQEADVGLLFKGFWQIYEGATPFRYKLLQEVTVTTNIDTEKFYSDVGTKLMKSIGDSSTFSFRIKKSADLWATGAPPYTGAGEPQTISAFQTDMINNRVVPQIDFEGVQETEASSNEFIHVRFTGFVLTIEDTRNPTTGAPEVVITGEIKTIVTTNRQAT